MPAVKGMSNQPKRPDLNVGAILGRSRANGPGIRSVVWVQGCSLGCRGCINQHLLAEQTHRLHNPVNLGRCLVTQEPEAEGLTLSGGEPFEQVIASTYLLATVRAYGWTTVVYTGFRLAELCARKDPWIDKMLNLVDLLIDGRFLPELRTTDLRWRGSSNQEVHFLSQRYLPTVLKKKDLPVEEVIFNLEEGVATRSGILSKLPVL